MGGRVTAEAGGRTVQLKETVTCGTDKQFCKSLQTEKYMDDIPQSFSVLVKSILRTFTKRHSAHPLQQRKEIRSVRFNGDI